MSNAVCAVSPGVEAISVVMLTKSRSSRCRCAVYNGPRAVIDGSYCVPCRHGDILRGSESYRREGGEAGQIDVYRVTSGKPIDFMVLVVCVAQLIVREVRIMEVDSIRCSPPKLIVSPPNPNK